MGGKPRVSAVISLVVNNPIMLTISWDKILSRELNVDTYEF
jgi:hypothetical protein